MKKLGVWLALVSAAVFAMLSVPACSTVEGVGKDLERAGDAISDEARETRRRNN